MNMIDNTVMIWRFHQLQANNVYILFNSQVTTKFQRSKLGRSKDWED